MVAFDEATQMFEAAESPELRPVVATALLNKSFLLARLGRTQESIHVCDQLIAKFATDGSDPVAEPVATALFNRASMLDEMGRAEEALAAYDELNDQFGLSTSVGVLAPVANGQANKAGILFNLQRWDEALELCERVLVRLGNHPSLRVRQATWRAMATMSAVLSVLGRTREHLSACQELLNRLDRHDERVSAGEVGDDAAEVVLTLRQATHAIRVMTYIEERNLADATADIREILRTLPQLSTMPAGTIQTLMVASVPLGVDRMASLIRESPSADHLLPLTTALEWEMGEKPRVAIEIQKVAEDMRHELAEIREHMRVE